MSLATAQNMASASYTGVVNHEMIANRALTPQNATAQKIASYFMANPTSEVFHDDHAHSVNLGAKAGITNAGLNFMRADSDHKTPAAAPDKSSKDGFTVTF